MSFITKQSIDILTNGGKRSIKLCFGDITSVKNEKFDIIMISAFKNNYSCNPGTVIGALDKNLNLNVGDLSKSRQEDLTLLDCWISNTLPVNLPYKQLLCLEDASKVHLCFRALCAILGGKECSVISPILGTGNRNLPKVPILRSMVEYCAAWMHIGLPVTSFSIVVYTRSPQSLTQEDRDLEQEFLKLKTEVEQQNDDSYQNESSFETDLFVAYSVKDKDNVDSFLKKLNDSFVTSKGETSLTMTHHVFDSNTSLSSDQDDSYHSNEPTVNLFTNRLKTISKQMNKCRKILFFLSQSILSAEFVEFFNIAHCLSLRSSFQGRIVPMLSSTQLIGFPKYISLTQGIVYTRCSEEAAIRQLRDILRQNANTCSLNITSTASNTKPGKEYDIFLSYSHRLSPTVVDTFLEALKKVVSVHNIFIDRKMEKGYSWQSNIYTSLTYSRIVVALLCPDYFNSFMCREEFALGLFQHLENAYCQDHILLPVAVSDIRTSYKVHPMFTKLPIMIPKLMPEENLHSYANHVAQEINNLFGPNKIFKPKKDLIYKDTILENARHEFFLKYFKLVKRDGKNAILVKEHVQPVVPEQTQAEHVSLKSFNSISEHVIDSCITIEEIKTQFVICYHQKDANAANYLESMIQRQKPDCQIMRASNMETNQGIKNIEKSNVFFCLLNKNYLHCHQTMEYLQMAIHSHHVNDGCIVIPILLGELSSRPSFIHLIPARFASFDWWIEGLATMNDSIVAPTRGPDCLSTAVKLTLECTALWSSYFLKNSWSIRNHKCSAILSISHFSFMEPEWIQFHPENFKEFLL